MSSRRDQYLDAIGVTVWRLRDGAVSDPPVTAEAGAATDDKTLEPRPARQGSAHVTPGDVETESVLTLAELETQVAACHKCELAANRRNTVFGTGNAHADWMIIGEAPGADEDRLGEPFVGRAGQLLNAMIAAIGMRREDVYIANVLKCRPPNNRDPLGVEVAECSPYLLAQIGNIRPRIILALGRFAAQALLQTSTPISRLRGTVHRYGEFETPLVVSYHPAYLLRSPLEKRKAWQDLQLAMRTFDERGR